MEDAVVAVCNAGIKDRIQAADQLQSALLSRCVLIHVLRRTRMSRSAWGLHGGDGQIAPMHVCRRPAPPRAGGRVHAQMTQHSLRARVDTKPIWRARHLFTCVLTANDDAGGPYLAFVSALHAIVQLYCQLRPSRSPAITVGSASSHPHPRATLRGAIPYSALCTVCTLSRTCHARMVMNSEPLDSMQGGDVLSAMIDWIKSNNVKVAPCMHARGACVRRAPSTHTQAVFTPSMPAFIVRAFFCSRVRFARVLPQICISALEVVQKIAERYPDLLSHQVSEIVPAMREKFADSNDSVGPSWLHCPLLRVTNVMLRVYAAVGLAAEKKKGSFVSCSIPIAVRLALVRLSWGRCGADPCGIRSVQIREECMQLSMLFMEDKIATPQQEFDLLAPGLKHRSARVKLHVLMILEQIVNK